MTKLFDLSGRVALITGASRGLGLSMARGFLEAGAEVIVTSRHEEELRSAVDQLKTIGAGKASFIVADMLDRNAVKQLAATAIERSRRVDILVNNAGHNLPQPIDEITDETWDRIVELNLNSVMSLTRYVVPQMKKRRWGRVIHISSVMGIASKEGRNSYSATKAALVGMCKASALDLGPFNITVNCIAPGPFLTDLPGKMLSDAEKKVFADRTALGRWGDPRELAGPALLLASDAGSYITGAVLVVDGGALSKMF
jgi:NAD(P)-dependent dehydrogenase (short-subunit alcohol dehydrogenase family)